LSGALLAINCSAIRLLAADGHLLRDELFFMDDVELSDRARHLGITVKEVQCHGTIQHIGGVSMRQRPAVRIYFSRVSKVRYWVRVHPARGRLLGAFFLIEASVGWLIASRFRTAGSGLQKGTVADGFEAVVRWLYSRDRTIDERVLGNTR
jgi:GT2 family glycosyltransferase